jgi:hypothetical protein
MQQQETHEKYKDSISEYYIHEDKNISILSMEEETAIMELRQRKRVGEYGILNKCLKLGVKRKCCLSRSYLTIFWRNRKYHLSGIRVPPSYCHNMVLRMI